MNIKKLFLSSMFFAFSLSAFAVDCNGVGSPREADVCVSNYISPLSNTWRNTIADTIRNFPRNQVNSADQLINATEKAWITYAFAQCTWNATIGYRGNQRLIDIPSNMQCTEMELKNRIQYIRQNYYPKPNK